MASAVEHVSGGVGSLGGIAAVTDQESRARYAIDGVLPRAVVYPSSAEETASVLASAAERGLAVVPCRNATQLDIGAPPGRYDAALSLKNMASVWYYEPADLVITVEAGMKFGDFQHFVGRDGLWLPLDPPGGAGASIGGILATNAAGPLRILHGTPRDMTLGMKIATVEGKVIKAGGRVVKNVAGYDLGKSLVGSWGTLGVIVEATLKLFPRPARRETYTLIGPTLDRVREFRRNILASPIAPLRMAYLSDETSAAPRTSASQPEGFEIWIEAGGSERVMARISSEIEAIAKSMGSALAPVESERATAVWERISDFRNALARAHPDAVVLKASLPVAQMEAFLGRALSITGGAGVRTASVSYLGGETVYLGLVPRNSEWPAEATVAQLRAAAEEFGGAMIVERAPAELKRRVSAWGETKDDFAVMQRLKKVWDPKGILSPGRFIGGL